MKTILNLAMTAGEYSANPRPDIPAAYMACHFSPYGPGLENLPDILPENPLVILNDRIPYRGQDPTLIAHQLASLPCGSLLMDLENMEADSAQVLISRVISQISIPIAVSAKYAADHVCAVFLDPRDADQDPFLDIPKWEGRDIWLDMTPGTVKYTITPGGSVRQKARLPEDPAKIHWEDTLCSHYSICVAEDTAEFILWRTLEDFDTILRSGGKMGITRGVGLYQEWMNSRIFPAK